MIIWLLASLFFLHSALLLGAEELDVNDEYSRVRAVNGWLRDVRKFAIESNNKKLPLSGIPLTFLSYCPDSTGLKSFHAKRHKNTHIGFITRDKSVEVLLRNEFLGLLKFEEEGSFFSKITVTMAKDHPYDYAFHFALTLFIGKKKNLRRVIYGTAVYRIRNSCPDDIKPIDTSH